MEQVSGALSRTLGEVGGAADPAAPAAVPLERRRPKTLHGLAEYFEADEALENPDAVVPLRDLRSPDGEAIEVPGLGTFGFTDWSRRQCGALLGVRMDRWFENATTDERAEELNRRFLRATGKVSIRTTRLGADGRSAGTLRAFVSPGYTPIRDSALARMLAVALAPADPELRLVRSDVTDRTTSYVVQVGEAFKPGGSHEVGDVWGGILVRNSNVGFASLIVTLHLTRLLCKNGMTAPVPEPVLVRRRHTSLGEEALRSLLAERLEHLPARLAKGAETLRAARERFIPNVEDAISHFLDDAGLPRRHAPALLAAYAAEPHQSEFGIVQAATRAARDMKPELRVEFESAAAAYISEE